MADTTTGYAHLLGTLWRNKRTKHEYRVDRLVKEFIGGPENTVHLKSETKGGRSTWKYAPNLPFDYDQIKDAVIQ